MNDTITIKKEYKPMMRLTETELEYFEKNNLKILAVRFSLFALFNGLLLWCYKYNISYLLLSNIVLLVVYLLHNYFRNGVRFVTDTVLNLGKYIIPLFLFSIDYKSAEFLLYFIFFPLFRSITYIVEKGIAKSNIYVFQIIYSVFILIAMILMAIFGIFSIYSSFGIFTSLFIVYKIAVCVSKIIRR